MVSMLEDLSSKFFRHQITYMIAERDFYRLSEEERLKRASLINTAFAEKFDVPGLIEDEDPAEELCPLDPALSGKPPKINCFRSGIWEFRGWGRPRLSTEELSGGGG